MIDPARTLNWWTGRISNAELAGWTGQTERDVRLIMDQPFIRERIVSGGRGSKHTRRIPHDARNAVAIVAALRKSGMSIETACAILDAAPVIASRPTEIIDFSPTSLESGPARYGDRAALIDAQPAAGWLPSDVVPLHVLTRHARPVMRTDAPPPAGAGDITWLPSWAEARAGGLPAGLKSLGEPEYRPEIDPLGFYEPGNDAPDAADRLDEHFYVLDGASIWLRDSDPLPRDIMRDIFQRTEFGRESRPPAPEREFTYTRVADLDPASRTARRADPAATKEANDLFSQYKTRLDVNVTAAVRQMKRVALGLIPPPQS